MSSTPSLAEPEFSAFVALDWADREHSWALEIPGRPREQGQLEHTPEAIETWAAALSARFPGQRVAVALEQARGALLYALSKYVHVVLYPIHPATLSRYRAALFPSGSKSDPRDAELLLDLLVQQRSRLRCFQRDSEPTRMLRELVEKHRQLVDERTAQINRLTGLLKQYFPQALLWLEDLGSPLARALLQRWPTLPQLQAETEETVRDFFRQHHCRCEKRIEQRIQQISAARPLVEDPALVQPAVRMVHTVVELLAALRQEIVGFEQDIEEVFTSHPDAPIFASFPGAGPALAPRLLVAFGSLRDRFESANQVQSYSGIAPVLARSGETQHWIHFRWACPKFLRQTFHEFAALSIQQCGWAKEFYQQQRAKGKTHHAAVRALAFKWIRILFRCWQTHQPYQEERFLSSRQTRLGSHSSHKAPLSQPLPCANPRQSSLKSVRDVLKSLVAEA
jgi:transposase